MSGKTASEKSEVPTIKRERMVRMWHFFCNFAHCRAVVRTQHATTDDDSLLNLLISSALCLKDGSLVCNF